MNAAHAHRRQHIPVTEKQKDAQKKGNILAVAEDRTSTKDNWLGQLAGNSHSFGQDLVRGFVDLRDKQIEEGGVGGMRVHRGVASVQEHEVPGQKERGPQHRVRDSRSQVLKFHNLSRESHEVGE